jgi:hypothetical protein
MCIGTLKLFADETKLLLCVSPKKRKKKKKKKSSHYRLLNGIVLDKSRFVHIISYKPQPQFG